MWKTNLFCADAFYLSLAKRIHRCIPNQSFCAFFIFYQLFFCLLVLLSFWESSIALKSYRFLCQKDKSEKTINKKSLVCPLYKSSAHSKSCHFLAKNYWLHICDCFMSSQASFTRLELKTIKMNFLLALDLVVNKTSHWTIGVWTVGFKIENSIILAGPGVF